MSFKTNPMMTEQESMSMYEERPEAIPYKSNPMLSTPTSSKRGKQTIKSRKSFHFDKNHKTYYSYDEDTKATAWEDPPDKKMSSSSRSPGSDDAEKMKPETSNFSSLFVGKFKPAKKKKKKKKSDADDNRLPIPHEKSGSSGAELAQALAQTRSVSQIMMTEQESMSM